SPSRIPATTPDRYIVSPVTTASAKPHSSSNFKAAGSWAINTLASLRAPAPAGSAMSPAHKIPTIASDRVIVHLQRTAGNGVRLTCGLDYIALRSDERTFSGPRVLDVGLRTCSRTCPKTFS